MPNPKSLNFDTRARIVSNNGYIQRSDESYINTADEIVKFKNASFDQAGRVRVSLPITTGDYKNVFGRETLFFSDETNGTGSVGYNATKKSHQLQTSADEDWSISQTFQGHPYFAGKSQKVEITCFDFDNEANIEKRMGYYSSNTTSPFNSDLDGFYLYSDGAEHYLRIVNNGAEILDIAQSDWDDPLDGTGDSGYTINWANFNVFEFNFLWLGGTGLRLSVLVGAQSFLVHNYIHTGSVNADKLIFSSPNQPVRFEVRQTGAGSGEFNPVCCVVASEGSTAISGRGNVISVNTGASDLVTVSAGSNFALKGIRLKDTAVKAVVDIAKVDVFSETGNDTYRWEIQLNPVLSGTPSWTDVDNSNLQEANGDGTLAVTTAGLVLESGYAGNGSVSQSVEDARKLGASIDGTRDELWMLVQPLQGSTNANMFGALTVEELV